jgi:flagellar hook-associated protein 1 FlgK
MSLGDALSIAMAGLRANQASMSLVSSNVANAETPGYVRKTTDQVQTNTGSIGTGVNIVGVNRELDQYILAQLRTETSGASYASLKSNFLQQVQGLYGNPDGTGTLESSFNALTSAVQALSTSPDSASARIGVVNAAQAMASQLNSMSQGLQTLRGAAETGIKDSVSTANNLMQQIATINNQLQTNPLGGTSTDSATAALLDQRDQYVTQLSQLMDIRVTTNGANQVTVFTGSGVQLVGNEAAKLSFNAQGTVTPNTTWDANPAISNLGSISVTYANGGSIDLTKSIKSGKIAAYVELRDSSLVEAQNQLDQFAGSISSALSDTTTAGTVVTTLPSTQTVALNAADMKAGNVMHLTYLDGNNAEQQISFMRVDNSNALPLSNSATADPNDQVFGIDFSGGVASVVNQLNAAMNGRVQFSGTSLAAITVQNNPGFSTITAASVTSTAATNSLSAGSAALSLFTDNGAAYSGAITGTGSQVTGLAGRLTVNAAVASDPSKLVLYGTGTAAGDTTRANFILQQLSSATFTYSPQSGVGGAPFKGTLLSYMQQFTSAQGAAASAASQLADGQNVVLNTLQQKMTATSGVNIDDEMAHLLSLQNAYSANARVMSTVNDMYKTLMQAF